MKNRTAEDESSHCCGVAKVIRETKEKVGRKKKMEESYDLYPDKNVE